MSAQDRTGSYGLLPEQRFEFIFECIVTAGVWSDMGCGVVEQHAASSLLRKLQQPVADNGLVEVEGKNIKSQVCIGQHFVQKFHDARPRLPAHPDVLILEGVVLSLDRAGPGFDVEDQIRLIRSHLIVAPEMVDVSLGGDKPADKTDLEIARLVKG